MRILYLTGSFPYPLDGGHLRYFHFIRELRNTTRRSVTSVRR